MKKRNIKFFAATFITVLLTGCNSTVPSTSSASSSASSSVTTSSITTSSSTVTSTTVSSTSSSTVSSSSSKEIEYFFNAYSNPVSVTYATTGSNYRGEVADPSVVRGDDGYIYAFSTDRVMLRSEDGCNFEYITNNIIDTPDWYTDVYPDATDSFHLWAPDVVKVGDKWIYYYSLSAWNKPCGVGYAVADNIAGPYEDYGKLFDINEIGIGNAIDPQVFIDDDGSVYMTVGSFQGLYMVQLTEDGMELLNGVEYQRDNKILIAGRAGSWDGSTYEGSYIIKRGEWYYYFGSAGTCCEGKNSSYRVYAGKSKSITGPYVDNNRKPLTGSGGGTTNGSLVLWAGMRDDKQVYGPGHNSVLVDDAGDYWIYYHAYSSADNFATRHLFMDKLLWDDNGFPYIENRIPSFQEELDGPRFII